MKINRRELVASAGASALAMRLGGGQAKAASEGVLTAGWQTVPLGGGGYVLGIDMAPDGTKTCWTDVGGAYWFDSAQAKWIPLCTTALPDAAKVFSLNERKGVWAAIIAPSMTSRIYMIYGVAKDNVYTVYRTDNHGTTWVRPSSTFTFGGDDPNGPQKWGHQRMAVDPNNPDIVYLGLWNGATINSGAWVSYDAGVNWTRLNSIDAPVANPGCCGIVIDGNYQRPNSTTKVGGVTVSKRVIIPSAGKGVWETLDGGATWTQISSPSTPPTNVTYTTSNANSVIVLQVAASTGQNVTSITNDASDPSSLSWTQRAHVVPQFGGGSSYEFAAVAPVAGTYHITVHYTAAGAGSTIGVFAVKDVDVSRFPTSAFDTAVAAGAKTAPTGRATLTTNNANDFIFYLGSDNNKSPDTGWSPLTIIGYYYSEYITPGAAGTFTPGPATIPEGGPFFSILDAMVQKTGGTIGLDGRPKYFTSGSGKTPGTIWTAQMDYAAVPKDGGTYYAVDQENTAGSGTWRYQPAGSGPSGWDRMDGSGNPAYPSGEWSYCITVDPRPGHEGHITACGPHQAGHGYQTQNGRAPIGSVAWRGTTGGGTCTMPSPDIPWMAATSANELVSVGDMYIDPTDGKYWMAQGNGVLYFNSTLDFYNNNITGGIVTKGIEQLVCSDSCRPSGAPYPVFAVEDRVIMSPPIPAYPKTYFLAPYGRSNCSMLDYASNEPNFMCGIILAQGNFSAYSLNYGVDGSWVKFNPPPTSDYPNGGCIVAATRDNIVAVNGGAGTQIPVYSKNATSNPCAWAPCAGLPAANYVNGPLQYHTKALAADRVDIGTFYACIKSGGLIIVYKSTDGGANFNATAGKISVGNSNPLALYMLPVPGRAGHLWVGGNSQSINNSLYRTVDYGTTWTTIRNVGSLVLLGLGKEKGPGYYPTLFIFGTVGGVAGFYRSTDEGASWENFGRWPHDVPPVNQSDYAQCLSGDWNAYGVCYVGFGGTGFAYYTPP